MLLIQGTELCSDTHLSQSSALLVCITHYCNIGGKYAHPRTAQ